MGLAEHATPIHWLVIFPRKWPWGNPRLPRCQIPRSPLKPPGSSCDASRFFGDLHVRSMFHQVSAVSYNESVEKNSGSLYMTCLTSPWGALCPVWHRFHTWKTCRPAFPTFTAMGQGLAAQNGNCCHCLGTCWEKNRVCTADGSIAVRASLGHFGEGTSVSILATQLN